MNPSTSNKPKIIAGVVIIVAIALLAIGANALKSDSNQSQSSTDSQQTSQTTPTTTTSTDSPSSSSATSSYKDGTYNADADYQTPGGSEDIKVTVTVQDGTVTNSSVSFSTNNRQSGEYQGQFESGYKSQVVGKKLSDINLSHVSGSSLTPNGFNEALEAIKTQAAT